MTITFEKVFEVDNGARFFNADLHIHTYGASECVSDSSMTVAAIIDQAIKNHIAIVAITDHNSDKNIEAAVDYAQQYIGSILVIPGVEVTTANGHLLAYFSPDNWENVRNFLARLEIIGKPGERDSHTAKSMADAIKQAEALDGVCVAAHIDRKDTGFEMIDTGYPNWKKDIIVSPGLYGIEVDAPENLLWYSAGEESSANGSERKKLIDERLTAVIGRPTLAHLQGSDAHSLQQFIDNCTKRSLTRIKMNELNYKSFRTALVDPEARIRAIADLPLSVPRIRGICISGGFLNEEIYHFSDNLNCFIGGRGAGKSTAIKSLAYGLGIKNDFSDCDNCPDVVVVYCEDANGVVYKYERNRGADPVVKAREDGNINNVPPDAFPVEYYGQGELSEVAKDPLRNPILLQEFLDRHLHINDLEEQEQDLLRVLRQNSAQLLPLENIFSQLPGKASAMKDIDTKLQVAETGKLKEIVAQQNNIGGEKGLRNELSDIITFYSRGISLTPWIRNFQSIVQEAKVNYTGQKTENLFIEIEQLVNLTNKYFKDEQIIISNYLKEIAVKAKETINAIDTILDERQQELNDKMIPFREQGLSGTILELQQLVNKKNDILKEIGKINAQNDFLQEIRSQRGQFIAELYKVREEIAKLRKGQLKSINRDLARIIIDYTVYLHYDETGITNQFKEFLMRTMRGSYFPEEIAGNVCKKVTPGQLAGLIRNKDLKQLASTLGITEYWANEINSRMQVLTDLFELEIISKPACPVISVKTKGAVPKEIRVNQLSDGQKHTILLAIAMLADSKLPLIIDQPEDDLDNAFISSSVVTTLRAIKERRQVIVVTHNANIAVLGDAELIFPMSRKNDKGTVGDRGSIDRGETRDEVIRILEGGDVAFKRRKEIYGY